MLEKIVECMKNNKKRKEETEELKLKTEEDFVKEVVKVKQTNVLLKDQFEIAYKENEILKETLQQVKDKKKVMLLRYQKSKERPKTKRNKI